MAFFLNSRFRGKLSGHLGSLHKMQDFTNDVKIHPLGGERISLKKKFGEVKSFQLYGEKKNNIGWGHVKVLIGGRG